jgi:hypothetical protein
MTSYPGDAHSSGGSGILTTFLLHFPLRVPSDLHYTPLQHSNPIPSCHRSRLNETKNGMAGSDLEYIEHPDKNFGLVWVNDVWYHIAIRGMRGELLNVGGLSVQTFIGEGFWSTRTSWASSATRCKQYSSKKACL